MTQKLKNRLQKMKFQKHQTRKTEIEEASEDDKIYIELYRKRTMELLGKTVSAQTFSRIPTKALDFSRAFFQRKYIDFVVKTTIMELQIDGESYERSY